MMTVKEIALKQILEQFLLTADYEGAINEIEELYMGVMYD